MKQRSYALLMIDFQNDFCKEGGYGDRCGGLDWVRPVIPRARELLDAARAYGVPVALHCEWSDPSRRARVTVRWARWVG